ncbi:MAG: RNA polymerase sigma-54 factor [Proteiniphilum acetatigenes]|uniref:RNA polymerase sigma-54 factor n=1 Tax=Proteiniphilum acetatigenes TaxID=294710 RepID=A0A117LZP5_9BACT|nr:MAG: RNA polymerase sigma-54 factor [Proteiniphilum acetatigenes]KUL20105.1 MAG: RNA polymerase sigma-54 factor [Proteiniphilum sp. 51_7]HCC85657.1 RNA polymerase sigma-54 factor [Porphyromonadaceae bacterium]
MALKQQQELKQTQRLSPLQMQVIKLVELNTVEVEDRIKQEVEDNPALETDNDEPLNDPDGNEQEKEDEITQDEIMLGDYISDEDIPDYHIGQRDRTNEQGFAEISYYDDQSLTDSLLEQLSLLNLDERRHTIATYIIGNLDENGYLQRELQAIADDLLFQQQLEVTPLQLEDLLYEIQELDPAGVGARNLQECLLLQLARKEPSAPVKLAEAILTDYFEAFSRKHFDKIIQQMNITPDDLRNAIEEITSLNPKPGNAVGGTLQTAMNNITPDFLVDTYNGQVTIQLNNSNIPNLKVNNSFYEMLKGYQENRESMSSDDKQAMLFMKQKVDSAKWFIDAVKQRQNTLQRTMEAIVNLQYDFFLNEDESQLKPMVLKDVAEKTGFDISTVSRVSNSKYVQTNNGIYPLKYFFSEAMQTSEGEDISSREVKMILKESIEGENPKRPLTDDQLTRILNEKGYLIARRTVAKYREQLNIPVSRLRKKM